MVMNYCNAGTLRDLMQSEAQLSLIQRIKLIIDVLAGLEHAHSRGIIHCDIKPENILLNLDTTGWLARISDFGIARLVGERCSDSLRDAGSPAYMAPERFYGQYSFSSDLYAVGILLFELVVGYRPFSGLPGNLMSAHLNQPVKVPDTVPLLLRSTISAALQKLPARRFASAAEMLLSIRLAADVEGSRGLTKG
jgi:serine/threonine-protein kinase